MNIFNFKNKKSAVVVSISWVIMTVIGVIFLAIAYKVVIKYEEYSDTKVQIKYTNFLNNILRQVGEGVGLKENSIIETNAFKGKKISTICVNQMPILQVDDIFLDKLSVFKSSVLFMHNLNFEDAEKSYILTQRYDLPFVISNFVIIASDKQKLFLDKNLNKDFLDSFIDSAFEDMNNEVVDFSTLDFSVINSEIEKYNYKQVIFVGDYSNLNFNFQDLSTQVYGLDYVFAKNPDSNFYKVDLKVEGKDLSVSEYSFVDYKETFSISKASIFASPENLDCSLGMVKKLTRTNLDFYKRKASYLLTLSNDDKVKCNLDDVTRNQLFEQISDNLQNIESVVDNDVIFIEKLDNLQRQNKNINYKCKEDYTIY